MISEIAATLAAIGFIALAGFQLLLAMGRPLGRYAWGGYHEILPKKLQLASAGFVLIYLLAAGVVLDRANIANLYDDKAFIRQTTWALAIWLAIGVAVNGVSKSRPERMVMTPVAAVLSLLCFAVALFS